MNVKDFRQAQEIVCRLERDMKAINSGFQVQCSACMHEEEGTVLSGYSCVDELDMIRLLSSQIMNYGVNKGWGVDELVQFLDGLVKSVGINYMSMANTSGYKS